MSLELRAERVVGDERSGVGEYADILGMNSGMVVVEGEGGLSRSMSRSDHSFRARARACRAMSSSAGMEIRGTNEGGRVGSGGYSGSTEDDRGELPVEPVAEIC